MCLGPGEKCQGGREQVPRGTRPDLLTLHLSQALQGQDLLTQEGGQFCLHGDWGGMSWGCPCSRGLRTCQLRLHVTGLAHWAPGQVPSTGRPGSMATPGPGQPLGVRGTESAARWTSHSQPPFQGRKPFSGPGSVGGTVLPQPASLPADTTSE